MVLGALSGVAATAAMTVFTVGAQRLGLLGSHPPRVITGRMLRRLGIHPPAAVEEGLALGAHVAFGAGGGALFAWVDGALPRKWPTFAVGAAYGLAIWATSYEGWIPALRAMPPAHRDRPFRPTTMFLGHVIYGAALAYLTRATHREPALEAHAAG